MYVCVCMNVCMYVRMYTVLYDIFVYKISRDFS